MTKKELKNNCHSTVYTGGGNRINAFFFDWQKGDIPNTNKIFVGYKYMVYANVRDLNKKDLFDIFYKWIMGWETLPWYVKYKLAKTDEERFKVSLSL